MDRKLINLNFKNAVERKPQAVPPIWMMRQAGRYHKHYQALKEKYTFMQLCKEPELAAEVALGPVLDFDFDVSILFSDLLFPLEAFGMGLKYDPGPILDRKLTANDLKNLKSVDEALPLLQFQKQAMQITRERLPKNKSLIGFVGGPWTLFSYAVGGSHDGHLIEAKKNMGFFKDFSKLMIPLLRSNIQLQLDGGAEVVMIFDTSAGELSPGIYQSLVQEGIDELAEYFPGRVGYYSKGTQPAHLSPYLWSNKNLAGLGVDHRWNMVDCLRSKKCGFTQGNFDQALLFMDSADFQKVLKDWIAPLKSLSQEERAGWVCGLGHGVLPKTPEANVRYFVQAIRKEFANL